MSPWKQEEGQKTKFLRLVVSCNLGTLHFTDRTEPGTEKSLIYSFIRQVSSQGFPWVRYCFRYNDLRN